MTIYTQLTGQFNAGQTRAILAGGQAVVMHGLAMMSKDGDWVVRESADACDHILGVLSEYGATYRFGAPLDVRWLAGGWSSHFEFQWEGVRVRADFVTRPPRIDTGSLSKLWLDAETTPMPVTPPAELAEMKKTLREKDYAVIGELARLIDDPEIRLLHSRSARDILELAKKHAGLMGALALQRPALRAVAGGRDELEEALDRERRQLMRADEARMSAYMSAAEPWAEVWLQTQRMLEGLPLEEAHKVLVEQACMHLPYEPAASR